MPRTASSRPSQPTSVPRSNCGGRRGACIPTRSRLFAPAAMRRKRPMIAPRAVARWGSSKANHSRFEDSFGASSRWLLRYLDGLTRAERFNDRKGHARRVHKLLPGDGHRATRGDGVDGFSKLGVLTFVLPAAPSIGMAIGADGQRAKIVENHRDA